MLMTAQTRGARSRAKQVAIESADRIPLSRAPHMKYRISLGPGAPSMARALAFFSRVAKETDNPLEKSATEERGFICEALRIPYAPFAPCLRGASHPIGSLRGNNCSLGYFPDPSSRGERCGPRSVDLFARLRGVSRISHQVRPAGVRRLSPGRLPLVPARFPSSARDAARRRRNASAPSRDVHDRQLRPHWPRPRL